MNSKIWRNTQKWQLKPDPLSVKSLPNSTQENKTSLDKFSNDFGKILLQHIRDVGIEKTDRQAKGLGRYLRAARLSAGLTPTDLALRAEIPSVQIYGLERGLIHSESIDPVYLQRLACVLDEDITIFGLLLGRDITI